MIVKKIYILNKLHFLFSCKYEFYYLLYFVINNASLKYSSIHLDRDVH